MAGRPTTYTDEVLEKALEYATTHQQNLPEGELIHTAVGLCRYISRSHSTVYSWKGDDDKKQFLDILSIIEESQHIELVNGGLGGSLNSTITKMMLTKHGYSDKQEIDHTSAGEQVTGLNVTFVKPKDEV